MDKTMLDGLFDYYCGMKREAIDTRDPELRDIPMLLYIGEGPLEEGDEQQVLCVVLPDGRDTLLQAMAAVLAQKFIPYWAAVLSDGWTASVDIPHEYHHAGGLEEFAKVRPDVVKECLTLTAADHTGEVFGTARTYWFDGDGDIWFDDDEGPSDASEGPLVDVLREITKLYGMTQPEIMHELMKRQPDMN